MVVVRWVAFGLGFALVAATTVSAAQVLVVARSRAKGLGFAVERRVWLALRRLAPTFATYERADGFLAASPALKLASQAGGWLLLFWLGYGLMLWPLVADGSDSAITAGLGAALRESGSSMLTLGFASTDSAAATVVDFLASLSGFGLITLFIAYLPSLYAAFSRREALVTMLDSRGGSPPWGPEILARHQLVGITDNLPAFYDDWEEWAADVAESHTNYPVLLGFRSPDPWRSWLIALIAVCDAAAMHLALNPSTAPSEARLCVRMGFLCLRSLASESRLPVPADPSPDDDIRLTFEEFVAGVEHVEETGFECERTAEQAWPHFKGWRVNYEQAAYGLADLVLAPPTPWSGPRRLFDDDVAGPVRPPHRTPAEDDGSPAGR